MTTEWVVTTAAERITLDDQRQAELTFTVTNTGAAADSAVFEIVPLDQADPSWFQVIDARKPVRAAASVSYQVKAAIPAQAPPGDYAVQGRVYSSDSPPEESSVLSSRVLFTIKGADKPKKRRIPWWVFVVAGLVVVVLAVTVTLVVRNSGGGSSGNQAQGTVAMPDLSKLTVEQARTVLADSGLAAHVRYRQDPDHAGLVEQTIPAGTRIEAGSAVDVVFHVSLKAPTSPTPAGTVAVKQNALPTLGWSDPDSYVTSWRVTIRQQACLYYQGQVFYCNDLLEVDQIVSIPSYIPTLAFQLVVPGTNYTTPANLHSGAVSWQVQPVDDYGNVGPASATSKFTVS